MPALRTCLVAGALSLGACSGRERPPDISTFLPPAAEAGPLDTGRPSIQLDTSFDAAPVSCAVALEAGSCACTEVGQKPTSVYLVLDRSGSMRTRWPPSGFSTWDLTRFALLEARRGVLRSLGSRIAIGAAVFPKGDAEACAPGAEIFPLKAGSEATYTALAELLVSEIPSGLTPTAATLQSLLPTLLALPRPAYVLLATDGAPNCGNIPCPADRCSYNVEKVDGCDEKLNCCDPEQVSGGQGLRACIDSTATREAVRTIAEAGIPVFVLGAPGTDVYAAELNALAEAGKTARPAAPGTPSYYAATSATQEALEEALGAIASKVVESCTIRLEGAVEDPGATNVLLDGAPIAQDAVDGWSWASSETVRLNGRACARIEAGSVSRVQVVVGCRTIIL